ncbi:uncharacterized protein MELLADRAFT_63029 [Melampsora larici-populina 98AG31]|uniref:Uncharacterized protein n=1 Tax=Melampsora larici-populina (strain 98AG31 / pathotype 3-4-7) TaxID=747676 RepID=F4RL10_MELLP|nr:uncharacterized protein MELLADRAFT_63029 [Melampsora larici-populina 98AG31]EGG06943.1 hypothetical protein MELLADRAFT_63029 [Melampsora larici-populina 98AG31]
MPFKHFDLRCVPMHEKHSNKEKRVGKDQTCQNTGSVPPLKTVRLAFSKFFSVTNRSNSPNQRVLPCLRFVSIEHQFGLDCLSYARSHTANTMPVGFISLAQASSDEYFVQFTSGANMGHWMCKLCTSRTFKDKSKHCKLKTHIDRVRVELERRSMSPPAVAPPGLGSRASQSTSETAQASLPARIPDDGGVPNRINDTKTKVTSISTLNTPTEGRFVK